MYVWESLIPQALCVVVYWKILKTLRRKAGVMPAPRRQIAVAPAAKEPVAGTSKETTKPSANNDAAADKSGKDKGTTTAGAPHAGQGQSSGLSKAQMNVVKTLIFVIIAWFITSTPMDFYFLFRKFAVYDYLFII